MERNNKLHKIRGSKTHRDIDYALNRMKDIIVDAESYGEEINELDEKTRQMKNKA